MADRGADTRVCRVETRLDAFRRGGTDVGDAPKRLDTSVETAEKSLCATPIAVSAAEGYALWAENWESTPSPIVAVERRALLPWIDSLRPRLAIDVGCGTGRWAEPLHAVGLDLSPAMLAIAADKPGLHGRLAAADATTLPIRTACADLVLCTLTLGHLRNPLAAMHEFSRVLEPGGTLILTDFDPGAAALGWRRTFRRHGQTYEIENHPYTLEQLQGAVGLVLREWAEATIGPHERPLFEQAGRLDLFEAASRTPAVLLTRWSRL